MKLKLKLRPPAAIQRLWYRRLGMDLPLSVGSTGPWHADYVRLVPYRYRRFHQTYATAFGFFWMPCPLCNRPFGGHEGGESVPDPTNPPNGGLIICSDCTQNRRTQ